MRTFLTMTFIRTQEHKCMAKFRHQRLYIASTYHHCCVFLCLSTEVSALDTVHRECFEGGISIDLLGFWLLLWSAIGLP